MKLGHLLNDFFAKTKLVHLLNEIYIGCYALSQFTLSHTAIYHNKVKAFIILVKFSQRLNCCPKFVRTFGLFYFIIIVLVQKKMVGVKKEGSQTCTYKICEEERHIRKTSP